MSLNRRTLLTRAAFIGLSSATLVAASQTAAAQSSSFDATIQITGDDPVNLRALADAAGFNGAQDANISFIVGPSVTLTGAVGVPDGGAAIETGAWPAGHANALSLQVDGKVYGGGGAGARGSGAQAFDAGRGGDAIICQTDIAISVAASGEVKAGGGGGGGGGAWNKTEDDLTHVAASGGGGGGGFPNGAGGAGANGGSSGGLTGGGDGGASKDVAGSHASGNGGIGGGAGAAGATGAQTSGQADASYQSSAPSSGGAAGFAVRKNGCQVSVANNGSIMGAIG